MVIKVCQHESVGDSGRMWRSQPQANCNGTHPMWRHGPFGVVCLRAACASAWPGHVGGAKAGVDCDRFLRVASGATLRVEMSPDDGPQACRALSPGVQAPPSALQVITGGGDRLPKKVVWKIWRNPANFSSFLGRDCQIFPRFFRNFRILSLFSISCFFLAICQFFPTFFACNPAKYFRAVYSQTAKIFRVQFFPPISTPIPPCVPATIE